MNNSHFFLLTVLSSSLVSAAFASTLTGIFALRSKRTEYVNDYYKQVLQKRLSAYELIDTLILNFKICSPNPELRMVHIVFNTDEEENLSIYKLIFRLSAEAFWLSDDIFQKSREIDILLIQKPDGVTWREYGAAKYEAFATIRTDLEKLYARDLSLLHEVPKFLKSKRHLDDLQEILIPRSAGLTSDELADTPQNI